MGFDVESFHIQFGIHYPESDSVNKMDRYVFLLQYILSDENPRTWLQFQQTRKMKMWRGIFICIKSTEEESLKASKLGVSVESSTLNQAIQRS